MTAPPLRAVLFDRDDTLTRTDPAVAARAAAWVADRHGLDPAHVARVMHGVRAASVAREDPGSWWHQRTPAHEDEFWAAYARTLARLLPLPDADARAWLDAFPYEANLVPQPGARAVLLALRALGLRVGVLSNTLPSIDRTLRAVGLADVVDAAVASCSVGAHKPDPAAFRAAVSALGVPPGSVLFVDDKAANVDAARREGLRAAVIDHSGRDPDALPDLHAVLHLAREGVGVTA